MGRCLDHAGTMVQEEEEESRLEATLEFVDEASPGGYDAIRGGLSWPGLEEAGWQAYWPALRAVSMTPSPS